jgi:hypothetical protein
MNYASFRAGFGREMVGNSDPQQSSAQLTLENPKRGGKSVGIATHGVTPVDRLPNTM